MSLRIKKALSKLILSILIISINSLCHACLFAGERNPNKMNIALVAVGKIAPNILEFLKSDLNKVFYKEVLIGKGMPNPDYAFNKKRNQYLSTAILSTLLEQKEYTAYEKILGVVDHDLYVPELNFVFGEAGRKVAVISLTRLRQEFYKLPKDRDLFYKRLFTEAVHELGHTYGSGHYGNPQCVMFCSNSLMDTDRKGPDFCPTCRNTKK